MASQGGGGPAPPPPDTGKMFNLNSVIDKSGCYARNEAASFPMTNLFIGDSRLGCQSDTDEQLILHVAFHEFVKVKSFKITEFNQGINPEMNPTTIKLFVNRENIGFEDCDDIEPTQQFELTADDLKENGKEIMLKFVRFQRVKSITIFVEDNAGAEVTGLGALSFTGKTVAGTNMNDLKKSG